MDLQSKKLKKCFIETQFFIDDEYIGMTKTRNFLYIAFEFFNYKNKKYKRIATDREFRIYNEYTIVIDQINMTEHTDNYQKWDGIWTANISVLTK